MADQPVVAMAGAAVSRQDVLLATQTACAPRRPGFVPRPRLVARLEEGLAREPVLVYPQPDPARLPLTDRELQVLAMLAAGTPNQALAGELFISLDTVQKHVSHVLGKLGAANRTEAVARARDLGLLP